MIIKEAPLGAWFKPFAPYRESHLEDDKLGLATKSFYFNTPGFRVWYAHLMWDQEAFETYKRNQDRGTALVILSNKDIVVSEAKLSDIQREIEGRLMYLHTDAESSQEEYDEWLHTPPSYNVSLRSPSGMEYTASFTRSNWRLEDDGEINKYKYCYIHDSEVVMDDIEMKIDRLETP